MKMILKVTLATALFMTTALADDGQMGSGGRCTGEGCIPPPCTENCGGNRVEEPLGKLGDRILIEAARLYFLKF